MPAHKTAQKHSLLTPVATEEVYRVCSLYYLAISTNSISSLSGLISEVTLKCGHLANQATMFVPNGGWNSVSSL